MAIFIGRNIEENSKAWLNNQRIDYREQALIDIRLIEPDFVFFRNIKKHCKNWIITSKWAAEWLQLFYEGIGFNLADTVFCLSDKQANILAGFTTEILIAEKPNLKSLVKLIQQRNENKLCVYLKGNRSLTASRLEMVEAEVYQNYLLKPDIGREYAAYLFFSPSGIESFVQGRNKISENAKVIVIGHATAQKAEATFQNQVVVSAQQNELATIQTAVQHFQ